MMTVMMMNMWYVNFQNQFMFLKNKQKKNRKIISGHSSLDLAFSSQLEDLEVTVADHIQKVLKPNFGAAWEEIGDEFEKEETFALATVRTLDGQFD